MPTLNSDFHSQLIAEFDRSIEWWSDGLQNGEGSKIPEGLLSLGESWTPEDLQLLRKIDHQTPKPTTMHNLATYRAGDPSSSVRKKRYVASVAESKTSYYTSSSKTSGDTFLSAKSTSSRRGATNKAINNAVAE